MTANTNPNAVPPDELVGDVEDVAPNEARRIVIAAQHIKSPPGDGLTPGRPLAR